MSPTANIGWESKSRGGGPLGVGAARSDIAASARGFSERAGAALHDRLTFGAPLVRAGEMGAAIDDLERDMRQETAILFEFLAPSDQTTSK